MCTLWQWAQRNSSSHTIAMCAYMCLHMCMYCVSFTFESYIQVQYQQHQNALIEFPFVSPSKFVFCSRFTALDFLSLFCGRNESDRFILTVLNYFLLMECNCLRHWQVRYFFGNGYCCWLFTLVRRSFFFSSLLLLLPCWLGILWAASIWWMLRFTQLPSVGVHLSLKCNSSHLPPAQFD